MVDQCLQKQNDEHAHKCSCSEEYLVWKPELVKKPEVIYVSYLFILASVEASMTVALVLPDLRQQARNVPGAAKDSIL